MELIPAPGRLLKQHSFIISSLLLLFDLVQAVAHVYETQGALSVTTVAVVNLVMLFLANVAKLYQQNIPVTPEQKEALIQAAKAAPIKQDPKGTT